MLLTTFRIFNFRSIVDTGWCPISIDGITCLIGQNESGKTSILEALESFSNGIVNDSQLRSDDSLPKVGCRLKFGDEEFKNLLADNKLPESFKSLMIKRDMTLEVYRTWDSGAAKLGSLTIIDNELESVFVDENNATQNHTEQVQDEATGQDANSQTEPPTERESAVVEVVAEEQQTSKTEAEPDAEDRYIQLSEFLDVIDDGLPEFTHFVDFESLLPAIIDVEDIGKKEVRGVKGVSNLLKLCGLNVSNLLLKPEGVRKTQLKRISTQLTHGFQKFWSQLLGDTNRIVIEIEIDRYAAEVPEKSGKPYLSFWVMDSESSDRLTPIQRSRGVQWFLSFYLQLEALDRASGHSNRVLLVDEPGGSLHATAQRDALKVFENNKDRVQIIYTTHSPFMVDLNDLHRILAVQRKHLSEHNNVTQVLTALQLSAASTDTLTPLLTSMGTSLAHQNIIKFSNNVLLEEPSALYYLKCFCTLCGFEDEVQFIPATGASKLPQLALFMLGSGLDFSVVVDDDKSGRDTFNQLAKVLFCGDRENASKKIYKIKNSGSGSLAGIEDMFSKKDFQKFVLADVSKTYADTNSKFLKEQEISKPILAMKFKLRVDQGEVKMSDLSEETQKNIRSLVSKVGEMNRISMSDTLLSMLDTSKTPSRIRNRLEGIDIS